MDPYIPSAHPFYSKNSGEMLKVRPGPHVPLELTRSTFEAPITVARNSVRTPVRAENLPVLPLYSELELGAGRSSAPVLSPRKVPELPIVRTSEPVVLQTQERHVPVFKSIEGQDDESTTFDLPKSSFFPVPIPDPNAVPAPGYKSEGGDHIEEFVPKFEFKSEGGGICPLIPLKPSSPFVEKPGFKSEGGDAFVQQPVVPEAPSLADEVLAPVLQETLEQLKSRETPEPSAIASRPQTTPEPISVLAPVLQETSEQLESRVTINSPGIPLVPSPLESLTTAEPIEILAPVLMKTLEQLKSREIPALESMTAPAEQEASLSDFYKELIEEARSAHDEVAPVDVPVAQLDTIDTQWSNLSTKPEDEIQALAPIGSSQQPEVAEVEPETKEEPRVPTEVEVIYPTTQHTIQVDSQKSDYLQFEESFPQDAPVLDSSQETRQTPEASDAPEAPEAPKDIQIKNMDLLYDQVSYYQKQQEPAEFEVPKSVIVESVRSMILEPEVSAPREDSIRNGFEEFTHETVAQENVSSYQLSENERQLIEENKKFFESGQDHVESPPEINPIMMWSQKMTESYSTPDSPPVVESAGSPEPPAGNNGNERIPITELESLVNEFEQFDNDEIYEAEKHEKDVPPTM